MHDFQRLTAWNLARRLVLDVYDAPRSFPEEEKFGLVAQIRRAAVSVCSNIAEGSGRNTDHDFARFLSMATGSLSELESQLILAAELGMVPTETAGNLRRLLGEIRRMLYSPGKRLRQRGVRA